MISTSVAARLLGMSEQRVRALCQQGRIRGARRLSGERSTWLLPNQPRITPAGHGPALRQIAPRRTPTDADVPT